MKKTAPEWITVLANEVEQGRRRLGETQISLSRRSTVSDRTIRAIEQGRLASAPRTQTIVKLYRALELDPARVLQLLKRPPLSASDLEQFDSPSDTLIEGTGVGIDRDFKLFVGQAANERRNRAKNRAISEATGRITLIAQTGNAFLSSHHKLSESIRGFLRRDPGNQFTAIVIDPLSISAIGILFNWLRDQDTSTSGAGEQFITQEIKYQIKLTSAIQYYQQYLAKDFTDQVDLRFTPFDSGVAILATSNDVFIEPYFHANPSDRERRGLPFLEVEYSAPESSPSRTLVQSHIAFIRDHSVGYDEWRNDFSKRVSTSRKSTGDLLGHCLQHSPAKYESWLRIWQQHLDSIVQQVR